MRTPNALMCRRSAALHALRFRDTPNACHGNHTTCLTLGTACGCWAVRVPAYLPPSIMRPYADLIFSRSLLLCSPCTPHATRPTPDCSCVILVKLRWFVQHSYSSETHNRDQNSFRATRHTPQVQRDITKWLLLPLVPCLAHPYQPALQATSYILVENCPCSHRRYDRTSRRLSVSMLTTAHYLSIHKLYHVIMDVLKYIERFCIIARYNMLPMHQHVRQSRWRLRPGEKGCCAAEGWREVMVQQWNGVEPSSEAVPLHGAVRSKQRNKPPVKGCISVWMGGLFRRVVHTAECQGRRAERAMCVQLSTSPRTLLISFPTLQQPTQRTPNKIAFRKAGLHERFFLDLRSAASKPHFSKYIGGSLALSDRVSVEFRNAFILSFRNALLKRNSSASWVLNKYTAPIKIQSVLLVLAPFVVVVVQPHTTKSLTGGVLHTSVVKLSACSYIAGVVKPLYKQFQ